MENRYIISLLIFFILAALAWGLRLKRTGNKVFTPEVIAKCLMYLSTVSIMSFVILTDNFMISLVAIFVIVVLAGRELYPAVKDLATGWLWMAGFIIIAASAIMVFTKLNYQVLLTTYLFVVIFDGVAQAAGQLMAKQQLAAGIGRGKTWKELVIGGILASAAFVYTSATSLEAGIIYCAIFAVLAVVADACCTKVRQLAGIPGFKKTLAGYESVLDRFAGFLLVLLYFTVASIYNYFVN